ncbi:GLPGLI family protein [Spongiivirga citrea]|uniref:GLPGLI family protein n=1 Tax=Spongiivirga citrea TaxID=1481457 RepID=A0A6M0CNB2_9FLAO|nr:GLPGLI family protein [Spongiivirga citrea]NER16937.1 GLPGLI family protein [Spongiivirga citrea]
MRFILSVILIATGFLLTNAQQTKSATVTYTVSINPDIKKAASINSLEDDESKLMANNFINQALDVESTLMFTKNHSFYYVEPGLEQSFTVPNITHIFAGGKKQFYFDKEKLKLYKQTSILNDNYLVNIDLNDWQIWPETKTINGYHCQKATKKVEKNKKYPSEVWFSTDIKMPYGPSQYSGLPGLVVVAKSAMQFELKSITWHEEPVLIDTPDFTKAISEDEFKQLALKAAPGFPSN